MKKLIALLTLCLSIPAQAQILHPANWSLELSDPSAKKGDTVDLVFNVEIDKDWYLYSNDFADDWGPMPTSFTFDSTNTGIELIGKVEPIDAKKKYDSLWEGEYTYFKKTAKFIQKVKLLDDGPSIKGNYYYQVCTEIEGKCIPFEEDFDFSVLFESNVSSSIPDEVASGNDSKELLLFMLAAFLAGLAAILTPCVFPMIPMTVTFFTKKGGSKGKFQALLYGLSIIIIYSIIGSIIAPFMGPATANELATNWLMNVIFFIVFIAFALSFLGLYEITLPSSLVNKMDAQSDQGGIIGIFFMALTLVLVSFSCTGPIVGNILVESAGGLVLKPILGMFAFALAFALPFTLFALFPNLLNALPKSGGWLNSIKVVLGFLELAFAFKFLSIADQAYHWHILDREVYLAIWISIFTLLGFYFLGKLRLPHDSEQSKTSVGGLILAIATFSFVIYLIPGMFGAPLKALSGYLPPLTTQDFVLSSKHVISSNQSTNCETAKFSEDLHFPHDIDGYFDYDQALACARSTNKPLFIDFTGHSCVNCREMEARVWSDEQVLKSLKEDFVMLALYVDDKIELPENEWIVSAHDGKIKKTIGQINADFQITRFNNNAQPYYIILDRNEKMLVPPQAYNLDIDNFRTFLATAKSKYNSQNNQ